MPRDKKKTLSVQVENLKIAHEIISSSPFGKDLHPKLGKINSPDAFRAMLSEAMELAPRCVFTRLSGLGDVLWHYKEGYRFPDKVRLVAVLKVAHLVFTANDAGKLESLKDLAAAKPLRGKTAKLRDIDLGQKTDRPHAEKSASKPAVRRLVPEASKERRGSCCVNLPPNIIGAHFIALRGAADAFCEMVSFGKVELRPEDRSQMADIVITLLKLGKIDAETFQVALHGQPISSDDKDMIFLMKAFAGEKRNR